MNRPRHVVSLGGGNGQRQVAAGLVLSSDLYRRATMITTAIDDDNERKRTSTGVLRGKENDAGYYGDVTRIMDGLRAAFYGEKDWLSKRSATRFRSGISGEPFVYLFADLLDAAFGRGTRNVGSYAQAVKSIRTLLKLDEKDQLVRELLLEAFEYRLEPDDFPEHSFRNLFLFILERIAKRRNLPLSKALEAMHVIYSIPDRFRVMPVTWNPSTLKARTMSGETIVGQCLIDFRDRDPGFKPFDEIKNLWLDPPVSAAEEALQATLSADAVIISCGSLNSNVKGLFLVQGMKEALCARAEEFEDKAGFPLPIIYVVNLLNEPGDTLSGKPYTASDIAEVIHASIGRSPNCIIYHAFTKKEKQLFPCGARIGLGNLRKYQVSSPLERSLIWQRNVATVVPGEDAGLPPKMAHDPKRLGAVFDEILSTVLPGAFS